MYKAGAGARGGDALRLQREMASALFGDWQVSSSSLLLSSLELSDTKVYAP